MPGEIPYAPNKRQEQIPQKVTAKLRVQFMLGDHPTELVGSPIGYFHQQDATTLPANCLTYPSVNCFIPMKDKIVPRLGTPLLGTPFTDNWGSVGHLKKFGTMSGIETEIRVTKSNGANGDILEIWCPDFIAGVRQSTFSKTSSCAS